MNNEMKNRARNMVLGALVADAAALGFHWLYDQKRIREVAPSTPAFRAPTASDYEGVAGYFAHGHKQAGELSQYGEQALVLLRSVVANAGRYDKAHYEDAFRSHFGYGGGYVGYIDRPTRDTLDSITRAEQNAINRAKSIPFDGDAKTQQMMITKVLACIKQSGGDERHKKVEEAVRITHDDDRMVDYALKIVAEMESISGHHGADDDQLPAISKLPALIAAYAGDPVLPEVVESAVRVTNDNDVAVLFGDAAAAMMDAVLHGADPETAVAAGRERADPMVAKLIDEAVALRHEEHSTVVAKFGMACNLTYGFPNVVHNALVSGSYREAVRQNIYAGGDSCGRAILLGAILGAFNGVGGETGIPAEWIETLAQKDEIEELVGALVDS